MHNASKMKGLFSGTITGYKTLNEWAVLYICRNEIVGLGSHATKEVAGADAEQAFCAKGKPAGSVKLVYHNGVVVEVKVI